MDGCRGSTGKLLIEDALRESRKVIRGWLRQAERTGTLHEFGHDPVTARDFRGCGRKGRHRGAGAGFCLKSKQSDMSSAFLSLSFHVGTPNWLQQNFTRLTWECFTFEMYPDLA
jgi:hypothetical protein